MAEYFDGLETRDPAERERDLMAMLPRLLARAKAEAPYYARLFAQVDAASIASRTALAALPVTRKADLIRLQEESPPFGGMLTGERAALGRVFLRSDEHTSELQSLMRISYAVFC